MFCCSFVQFNCCGVFGPQDYEGSNWMTQDLGKGDIVAKTCCILSNTDHLDPKPVNSSWCQSDKVAEHSVFRHEEKLPRYVGRRWGKFQLDLPFDKFNVSSIFCKDVARIEEMGGMQNK
ncbi:uncharacterized protein NPIL_77321 [Nephila pilipes]|uniref:Uncharacterized protein n=1 Tax=Nephila pilipes TaxID=299642 RepID=A0A8X6NSU4_NEPPI|nr:uncharacterized protein NPIL_77321 [Nephila pilipes]